jgi:UDPglucose 6-dehydrogenase
MNKIAVIGIGRLGLCFALNLERIGYPVIGIDLSQNYIDELNNKTFKSFEPELESYLQKSVKFHASTDYSLIQDEEIEMVFCVVPTPSIVDGSFSHKYIDEVADVLLKSPKPKNKKHLIIACTTMPGYCDRIAERLSKHNYSVNYNPEFIAQGTIIRDQQIPDQILIGEGSKEATDYLRVIYGKMCVSNPQIHVMSRISAEITKLATNCFLTMKISFANSIGDLAITANGEPGKILKAIGADSRIGGKYLNYGFGFGGPCFPRDNKALVAFANGQNQEIPLSKATIEVNAKHLDFQLIELLNENRDEYIFDSITYKKGTDILEESQQLMLAVKLVEAGKKVIVENSETVRNTVESKYPNYFKFV